jgi:hypothetical protein
MGNERPMEREIRGRAVWARTWALTSFFIFFSYANCFIFSRISFILHRIVTATPLSAIPIGS